jgi:alanine racemase
MRFPKFALDGVRIGIMLYGGGALISGIDLKPVMSLYTRITHIHTLLAGEPLGYGGTYVAESDRIIATLPIGYADGFLRGYGGASVKVITSNGEREARLVGRICMDQCMIDVTGTGAEVGDTVMLFGGDRKMLEDLAKRAGTIDYECLCLISARVPRKLHHI